MSPEKLSIMVSETNMSYLCEGVNHIDLSFSSTFVVFSHSSDVVANTGCAYNTDNITDVNHAPMDHNTFFTHDSVINVIDQPIFFRKVYD